MDSPISTPRSTPSPPSLFSQEGDLEAPASFEAGQALSSAQWEAEASALLGVQYTQAPNLSEEERRYYQGLWDFDDEPLRVYSTERPSHSPFSTNITFLSCCPFNVCGIFSRIFGIREFDPELEEPFLPH